jgi:hypothetical protein
MDIAKQKTFMINDKIGIAMHVDVRNEHIQNWQHDWDF